MKLSHDEGIASHIGPESCAFVRKNKGEALTGESDEPGMGRNSSKICLIV
ncbi:MAG: hypothetical protein QME83_09225 [Thermodesulfobacteriota bacterium]|nr:hypothetical protein [Thermodesulfobacteriota bacterium]